MGIDGRKYAVNGRYAYTGQDIELALLETKVVDLTPWGCRLDNDSKMAHWPAWMKSASPARDPATQTDKSQFVVPWCANRRLATTENGFLGLVPKETRWRRSLCLVRRRRAIHPLTNC